MHDRRPLVVFDLDGVIARTDTMAFLLQRRLLAHPARALAGALPAAAWFALNRFPRARVRLSRALGRAALSGMTAESYRALAVAVGETLGRNPAMQIPEGVAAIRAHLRAGDEVVVTTGTEATLARSFLDALGLDEVRLLATVLDFDRRRVRYEIHNLGHNKTRGFAGADIELFYTDSQLDLPVALLARRTVLVNPDTRVARLYESRVAALTIVRWAGSSGAP